jgi:hypothetical protein
LGWLCAWAYYLGQHKEQNEHVFAINAQRRANYFTAFCLQKSVSPPAHHKSRFARPQKPVSLPTQR